MIRIGKNSNPELIRKYSETVVETHGNCWDVEEACGLSMICRSCAYAPYMSIGACEYPENIVHGAKMWLLEHSEAGSCKEFGVINKLSSSVSPVADKKDDRIGRALGLLTKIDFNENDYEDVIAGVLQAIDILQEPVMVPVEVDGKERPPVLASADLEGYDREASAFGATWTIKGEKNESIFL